MAEGPHWLEATVWMTGCGHGKTIAGVSEDVFGKGGETGHCYSSCFGPVKWVKNQGANHPPCPPAVAQCLEDQCGHAIAS